MKTTVLLAVVLVGVGCADRIERYEGTLSECGERGSEDTGSNDGARASLIIDRVEDPPIVVFAISNTIVGPDVATEFRPASVQESESALTFSGVAGSASSPTDYAADLSVTDDGYDGGFTISDSDATPSARPRTNCRVIVERVDQ
jgi:hypothetical protein